MIKLWFVPEILVFVREMSLKFEFGGRHAWLYIRMLLYHNTISINKERKISIRESSLHQN